MDDLLLSVDTKEKAIILEKDITDMLNIEFKLTKWATNFDEEIDREKALTIVGLEWSNVTDTLKVRRWLNFEPITHWTQRKVLLVVSSVFDHLGFIAPFVIRGRITLKHIWQTRGQQWDSNISEKLNGELYSWASELNAGEPFEVLRLYRKTDETEKNELHVFGDASEDAFCAVAYIVIENVMKTGNRLNNAILAEHKIHFHEVFMCSDSTKVIQWIRSSHEKQPTFVTNRVAEILDTSTVDERHQIQGTKNPSDFRTKQQ